MVRCCGCSSCRPHVPLDKKRKLPPPVRYLLVSYSGLAVAYHLGVELYGPFLRTLVACDNLPSSAEDHNSAFTGSAYCRDQHYVLTVAQGDEGRLVGMKLLLHGWVGPILAVLADDIGRRPVLILGLVGYATAFALFALASASPSLHSSTPIVPFGFVLQGATSAFDVIYLSMLADMMPDQADRAQAFAAYFAVSAGGAITAQLLSVLILRQHLESYSMVWLILFVVLWVVVAVVMHSVEESLPKLQRQKEKNRWVFLKAIRSPLELVGDSFLRTWLLSVLLISLTTGLSAIEASFTLAVYGWRPGDLQACTWPVKVLQLCSITLFSPFFARYKAAAVTAGVTAASCITSLLAVLAPFAPAALLGPNLLSGIMAFGRPVTDAFLSSHFTAGQQAKVQAMTHLCNNFGTSISMALFSHPILFQPEARGWEACRPFALAALLACLGGAVRLSLLLRELWSGRLPPPKIVMHELYDL